MEGEGKGKGEREGEGEKGKDDLHPTLFLGPGIKKLFICLFLLSVIKFLP